MRYSVEIRKLELFAGSEFLMSLYKYTDIGTSDNLEKNWQRLNDINFATVIIYRALESMIYIIKSLVSLEITWFMCFESHSI